MISKKSRKKLEQLIDSAYKFEIILQTGTKKYRLARDEASWNSQATELHVGHLNTESDANCYKDRNGNPRYKPCRFRSGGSVWFSNTVKQYLNKLIEENSDLEIVSATYNYEITIQKKYQYSTEKEKWLKA